MSVASMVKTTAVTMGESMAVNWAASMEAWLVVVKADLKAATKVLWMEKHLVGSKAVELVDCSVVRWGTLMAALSVAPMDASWVGQ